MSNLRVWSIGLLLIVCCVIESKGNGCMNRPVEKKTNILLSPDFPNSYKRDVEACWLLKSKDKNLTIQISVIEMDLNDNNGECVNDVLEIESGSLQVMNKMQTWCGSGKKIFTTRDPYVRLRLKRNGNYGGRGFALEYGLIRQPASESQCSEDYPRAILVDKVPVYASFKGRNDKESCKWKVRGMMRKNNLVFEVYKPSKMSCSVGKFVFFEGEQKSGHRTFEFCSNERAFSKIYFASNMVTLALNRSEGFNSDFQDEDELIVKIYQQPERQNCATPVLVSGAPVMLSLPGRQTGECRMRLAAKDSSQTLRLDVMGEDKAPAVCRSTYVDVRNDLRSDNNKVTAECNRNTHPVYRGKSKLLVDAIQAKDVFLRVSAQAPKCNGEFTHLRADHRQVQHSTLPSTKGYINLSYCQALIEAAANDSISLRLKWERPGNNYVRRSYMSSNCDGDFVNVHSLGQKGQQRLYSTCQESGNDITMDIWSPVNRVMVTLDADKAGEGMPVMMEYYSTPAGSACTEEEVIVSNSPRQIVSSLYPAAPPLNYKCTRNLTAADEKDVIIVSVLNSRMSRDCQTMLTVYQYDQEVKKRLCGDEGGVFTLHGGKGALITESRSERGPGGWNVEVYTVKGSGLATEASLLPLLLSLLAAIIHLL